MQCAYCTFVMADPPGPTCPNCGNATMPPGYGIGPAPEPARLSGLGVAVSVLFGGVAVTQLLAAVVGGSGGPGGFGGSGSSGGSDGSGGSRDAKNALAVIGGLALLALVPVFLVWFYKARRNGGLWGPQRHGQGWSIGAWFTPVVFLWFPYQILSDVWRASEPATAAVRRRGRRGPNAVAKAWWACWVLAWASGLSVRHTTTTLPDGTTSRTTGFGVYLGGTAASHIFSAIAAVLGLLVVTEVTRMQEAPMRQARRPALR